MKRIFVLMLGVAAVFGLSTRAVAHDPEGFVGLVAEFPDSNVPVIDGLLGDWDAVVAAEIYTLSTGTGDMVDMLGCPEDQGKCADDGGPLPGDAQVTYTFGWNDTRNWILMAIEVFDDFHNSSRTDAGRFFLDDSLEITVFGTHAGFDCCEAGGTLRWVQYKYNLPPRLGVWETYRPFSGWPWLRDGTKWANIEYTFTGDEFGESTYLYELQVLPIESMPFSEEAAESDANILDLEPGLLTHMNIMANESDETDVRQAIWNTAVTNTTDMQFEGLDPDIVWGSPTAVEDMSWGRIKAQF